MAPLLDHECGYYITILGPHLQADLPRPTGDIGTDCPIGVCESRGWVATEGGAAWLQQGGPGGVRPRGLEGQRTWTVISRRAGSWVSTS